jgi:hypothetical protein
MYEAYFTKRLVEALALADGACDPSERSVHLRASGYYRELLRSAEKRRSPRHRTRLAAIVHNIGNRPRRVVVSDLSTGGFRATLAAPVRPGRAVALEMDGFAPVDAFVVWQEGDQLGCRFLDELHPAMVEAALAVGADR